MAQFVVAGEIVMIGSTDLARGLFLFVGISMTVAGAQPACAKHVRIKPVSAPKSRNSAPKWKPAYVSSSGKLIPGHFVARHPKY